MAPSATETVTTTVEGVSNGVGKLSLNGKVDSTDVCTPELESVDFVSDALFFFCRRDLLTLCITLISI